MKSRAALLGLALLTAACGGEAEPARPGGPVVDTADILSPAAEQALDARLRRYSDQKETAIVVATVPSLEGETIESTALAMYNGWGIGSPRTSRGVLLLVAPKERKLRITVGCGLETVVTDETAAQIIRENIKPQFTVGDFENGVSAGVEALITRIDTANVAPGPVSARCRQMMKDAA
ncbi:TPM domain-containing protein [Erythrobacter oryzae]|uniref:TPM domain-containing protein n=1 Tax=Erythrobacter oryzae TaxID=3019556 RepID=UPI002552815A|nr:TPM domain-containing protein [Erythrobacter sp. COR-2]